MDEPVKRLNRGEAICRGAPRTNAFNGDFRGPMSYFEAVRLRARQRADGRLVYLESFHRHGEANSGGMPQATPARVSWVRCGVEHRSWRNRQMSFHLYYCGHF
jgi:hypothetical protein